MRVLVVDDEESIRDSLKKFLELENLEVVCAENGLSAQRLIGAGGFDAGIVDLKMPGMNGLELLSWMQGEGHSFPCVMISAFGQVTDAVEAMKSGAVDYVTKPFNPEEIRLRLIRAVEERRRLRQIAAVNREFPAEEMASSSPAMREVLGRLDRIAPTPATVLITGESGTGKEVAARRLHRLSGCTGPFLAINLGGVPDSLVESELFGYERGAFTGAVTRKEGLLETAHGGTLFLDEIGDISPGLQVKMLRVVQEKTIRRLGGTADLRINARIITATNRDLETLVREEKFREDLYYRLNVARLHLPPLRERPQDLPVLTGQIIRNLNRKFRREVQNLSPAALDKLLAYSFPGNIRELENLLERAFIFADGEILEAPAFDLPGTGTIPPPVAGTLRELERRAILTALRRWEGNRSRAAEELGISRRTLFNKIRDFRLEESLRRG